MRQIKKTRRRAAECRQGIMAQLVQCIEHLGWTPVFEDCHLASRHGARQRLPNFSLTTLLKIGQSVLRTTPGRAQQNRSL